MKDDSSETVGYIAVLVFGLLWGFLFTFTGCMYLDILG